MVGAFFSSGRQARPFVQRSISVASGAPLALLFAVLSSRYMRHVVQEPRHHTWQHSQHGPGDAESLLSLTAAAFMMLISGGGSCVVSGASLGRAGKEAQRRAVEAACLVRACN